MDNSFINEILDNLKNNILSEYRVSKEDFLLFRQVLVKRDDFKQFRGIAERGGSVLYQYMDTPRS